MEEFPEGSQVGLHGVCEAPHWFFRKEQTKHRAEPMELIVPAKLLEDSPNAALQFLADLLKLSPAVDSLKFRQLGEPGRHCERIAGKRSGLLDRPIGG